MRRDVMVGRREGAVGPAHGQTPLFQHAERMARSRHEPDAGRYGAASPRPGARGSCGAARILSNRVRGRLRHCGCARPRELAQSRKAVRSASHSSAPKRSKILTHGHVAGGHADAMRVRFNSAEHLRRTRRSPPSATGPARSPACSPSLARRRDPTSGVLPPRTTFSRQGPLHQPRHRGDFLHALRRLDERHVGAGCRALRWRGRSPRRSRRRRAQSVRAITRKSGSRRAAAAARIFASHSSRGTISLSSRWPHFFGET